ncbi:MAG: NADP-dependent isocitrate dehydrogenase, partial [Acidimicrobiia bacterium]
LEPVEYGRGGISVQASLTRQSKRELVGVDVFHDWSEGDRDPDLLGSSLEAATPEWWQLRMITNRGVKVYPGGLPETFRADHWRCRFVPSVESPVDFGDILDLLGALHGHGFEVIKTEHLYTFDGEPGYSLGQGE